MTNEEAIEYAKATNYCAGCTDYECIDDGCEDCEHKIFFKMAIEALERKPITNEDVMQAFGMHTCFPAYDRNAETTIEFIKDCIAIRDFTSKH